MLHCRQFPKSNTWLALEIHRLSLWALRGWYTDGPESLGVGDFWNQEEAPPPPPPRVYWGGEDVSEALMQSLHNFRTEGWGTPDALIQPRSSQFGDSAAAEIWQIRTISQPPSGGSRQYNWKGGGEKRLRLLGCSTASSLALLVPPPLFVKVGV